MNHSFLSFLGLVRKSGKIAIGADAAAEAMKKNEACLLILSGELSEKSAENARFLAGRKNIEVISVPFGFSEIGQAIGKKAGILAVSDRNMARKLIEIHSETNAEKQGGYAI